METADYILSKVASFTEAWIEIGDSAGFIAIKIMSPPSRRRGLKFAQAGLSADEQMSPPSRRRGLKFAQAGLSADEQMSPPSRRRGLKFCNKYKVSTTIGVASFTEAWIEIGERNLWPEIC